MGFALNICENLRKMRFTLVDMGTLVDNAIDRSMEALLQRDTKLANAFVKKE